jgi:hypothetical protein
LFGGSPPFQRPLDPPFRLPSTLGRGGLMRSFFLDRSQVRLHEVGGEELVRGSSQTQTPCRGAIEGTPGARPEVSREPRSAASGGTR